MQSSFLKCSLVWALMSSSAWSQTQSCYSFDEEMILASPVGSSRSFASAIAADGTVAIVADKDDANGIGAAYIYRNDGVNWVQEQTLTPNDGGIGFGLAVDISGSVAVVSRTTSDCLGGVYVYRFDGVSWQQENLLVSNSVSFCANYGVSLALEGDVLMVGADRDDLALGMDAGAVVVYGFDGSAWIEEQVITAPFTAWNPEFGSSIALDGDVVAIAMPSLSFGQEFDAGSVHLYEFDGASWQPQQIVMPSDSFNDDNFGRSVALNGDRLAVSAEYYGPGRVYLYDFDGTQWTSEQQLTSVEQTDSAASSGFGLDLAVSGDRVAVAADGAGSANFNFLGAVYLFESASGQWNETKLVPSIASFSDHFGEGGVEFAGDELLVGAPEHNSKVQLFGADYGSLFCFDPSDLAACPESYCTATPSSSGCLATVGWAGVPSLSQGFFALEAREMEVGKAGFLFYGYAEGDLPFQGGTLCITPPLRRTAPSFSGGFSGCQGVLRSSLQLGPQSGADSLLVAGATVYGQFWFRDPLAASGVGFSDGVRFVVEP